MLSDKTPGPAVARGWAHSVGQRGGRSSPMQMGHELWGCFHYLVCPWEVRKAVSGGLCPSSPPLLPGLLHSLMFKRILDMALSVQMRCNLFVLCAFGKINIS